MYIIRKRNTNLFVAMPGSKRSYTNSVTRARKFGSYEEAKGNCCDNEYPVPVAELMK